METICSKLLNTTIEKDCTHLAHDAENYLWEIQSRSHELEHLFTKTRNRRSALFNIVGKTSKYLFGTMDSEDSENIHDRLTRLEADDESTFKLVKEQISVIKSNYNHLKKPIEELRNETESIQYKVGQLEKLITERNTIYDKSFTESRIRQTLNEIATVLIFQFMNVQKEQTTALSIIAALRNHKLHPLIVRYEEITELMCRINKNITIYEEFMDPHHLQQIISVDYYEGENGILVRINIPLPEENLYMLNKIYLLPIHLPNQTYIFLDYKTDYVAEEKNHKKLIYLSEDDIAKCKSIVFTFSKSVWICELNVPIILSTSENCIAHLLYNPFGIKPICNYKIGRKTEDWFTRLIQGNSWLFWTKKPRKFLLTCNGETDQLELVGKGIISFKDNCYLNSPELSLPVRGTIMESLPVKLSAVKLDYTDNFNITGLEEQQHTTSIDKTFKIRNFERHNYEIGEDDDINQLHKRLEETERERIQAQTHVKNMVQYSWITITALVSLAIFIIIIIFVIKRKIRRSNNNKARAESRNSEITIISPSLPSNHCTSSTKCCHDSNRIMDDYEVPNNVQQIVDRAEFDNLPEIIKKSPPQQSKLSRTASKFKRVRLLKT